MRLALVSSNVDSKPQTWQCTPDVSWTCCCAEEETEPNAELQHLLGPGLVNSNTKWSPFREQWKRWESHRNLTEPSGTFFKEQALSLRVHRDNIVLTCFYLFLLHCQVLCVSPWTIPGLLVRALCSRMFSWYCFVFIFNFGSCVITEKQLRKTMQGGIPEDYICVFIYHFLFCFEHWTDCYPAFFS